jgi:hypothetical protein
VPIPPASDHSLAFVVVLFNDSSSYPNDQHEIKEKIFAFNAPNFNKLKDHLGKLEGGAMFLVRMTLK